MSLVTELEVSLRDFMPHTPHLVAGGRHGPKCIISERLLLALKVYAAREGVAFTIVLQQLRDEIHAL